MTVASTTRRNDYDGNGTTATYAFTFKVFAASHLQVVVRNDTTLVETVLTLTTHYTVASSGINNTSGGNVVLVAGSFAWLDGSNYLKTGYSMTIRRVPPMTQATDIRNQGSYFPETHEDQFDLFMHLLQYHEDEITRSVKLQTTSSITGLTIPDVQADKALYGKADASGVEWRTATSTSGSYPGGFTAGLDAAKAASPSTNDVYIATDTKRLYVCFSSGTWSVVSHTTGVDASKAASPVAGDVYVATDTKRVYVCFVAGTWVQIGLQSGLDSAKNASPLAGEIYYATDTRRLYRCATAGTWVGGPVTLTPGTTVATDCSLGDYFTLTAAQNFTLSSPTNAVNKQKIIWEILQDATGSRVITLGAKFRLGTDITAITLTTTAAKRDYIAAIYDSTDDKFDIVGFVRGY